jgi:DNA-binding HxlR family transcriptional regulator
MPRSSASAPRSGCPISIALELFGDPWSLLIVRDLMFKGINTFGGFAAAGEGIASNILADRLSRLELTGIITKAGDPTDARRFVYRLTAKGVGLAPMLVELVLWSAEHENTDAPEGMLAQMRTKRSRFLRGVRAAWHRSGDLTA